jgi:hypothetical protein
MAPDRFRDCLATLHWPMRSLAKRLGLDERQVRRWAYGESDVPPPLASWLDDLARFHAERPAPSVSARRGRRAARPTTPVRNNISRQRSHF